MNADESHSASRKEPLDRFPLVTTDDIDKAEAQGGRLLSAYRLGVEEERNFKARLNGVSLGSVSLYFMDFGDTRIDVRSGQLDGFFGLILPVSGTLRLRYKGRDLTIAAGHTGAVVSPDDELRMLWSRDFSALVARVDKPALDAFADTFAPEHNQDDGHFEPLIDSDTSLRSLHGVVDTLHTAFARTTGPTSQLSGFPAARLREHLMTTLLVVQPNTYLEMIPTRPDDVSHGAVRRAVEMIECESAAELTVTTLAKAVGVSPRTLQSGFQRDLDMTPAGYIKQVRLSRAHDELTAALPSDGTTVADVAMRWGFHHVGRFAGYYREQFGVSPSLTLQSRR